MIYYAPKPQLQQIYNIFYNPLATISLMPDIDTTPPAPQEPSQDTKASAQSGKSHNFQPISDDNGLKPHKLAEGLRTLTGEEFENLKKSIETHGWDPSFPIITYNGLILDGVHRYKACQELGVKYTTREYEGDAPELKVLHTQLGRRNLTQNERNKLTADLLRLTSPSPEKLKWENIAKDDGTIRLPKEHGHSVGGHADAFGAQADGVGEALIAHAYDEEHDTNLSGLITDQEHRTNEIRKLLETTRDPDTIKDVSDRKIKASDIIDANEAVQYHELTKHRVEGFTSDAITYINKLLKRRSKVLDPLAGLGSVRGLNSHSDHEIVCMDINANYNDSDDEVTYGDATMLAFGDEEFDAIVTTPDWGAVTTDTQNVLATELSRTREPNDLSVLAWGEEYRDVCGEIWRECVRVLRPQGVFVLVIRDHLRPGINPKKPDLKELAGVTSWHIQLMLDAGMDLISLAGIRSNHPSHPSKSVLPLAGECDIVAHFTKPSRPRLDIDVDDTAEAS